MLFYIPTAFCFHQFRVFGYVQSPVKREIELVRHLIVRVITVVVNMRNSLVIVNYTDIKRHASLFKDFMNTGHGIHQKPILFFRRQTIHKIIIGLYNACERYISVFTQATFPTVFVNYPIAVCHALIHISPALTVEHLIAIHSQIVKEIIFIILRTLSIQIQITTRSFSHGFFHDSFRIAMLLITLTTIVILSVEHHNR